jgi:peroxiredoxin
VVNPLFETPAALEAKFNLLQTPAKQGMYGKMIEQMLADARKPKPGEVGTLAADFTQNDTANIPVKLSQFKGKYVLVDFWASWCRPCRQENPNVVEAYKAYKDKNFTVLGISLDQSKESWVKAINDDKLSWTHTSDLKYWSNEVAQLYQIQSIPANMLIDPDGKIIGKNLRGEELQAKLKELLK